MEKVMRMACGGGASLQNHITYVQLVTFKAYKASKPGMMV